MSWLTTILPLAATVLTVVLMLSVSGSSGMLSYLIFIPLMLASYLAAGIGLVFQRREYKRSLLATLDDYMTDLRQIERQLQDLKQREQEIRRQRDPEFGDCLGWAEKQDPRLGERRPEDDDFAAFRIGIGTAPASITIEPPSEGQRPKELSSHFGKIDEWVTEYSSVSHVPICLSFSRNGSIGLTGPRDETASIARSLICHLATHHWPTELHLSVICPPRNEQDWEWMKELPHSRPWLENLSEHKKNEPRAGALVELEEELKRREQMSTLFKTPDAGGSRAALNFPQRIVIVDHMTQIYSTPAFALLLKHGHALGVMGVFLAEQMPEVPGECGGMGEFLYHSNDVLFRFSETGPAGIVRECKPDQVSIEEARAFAHALGKIDFQKIEDVTQPPERVTFLDMLGANSLDDLEVEKWWDEGSPFKYLRAPIGKSSRDADFIFDLNEKDNAHGPHGLIGGMTGSGKSELLRTIILSFALTHHPFDLNFALVDYKGGATFDDLKNLPHTVGVISDIEQHANYGQRVILSLSSEIERRKKKMEEARERLGLSRSHVDDYRGLPVRRPLPRLIIVFDEFAEFRQRHPDESKALIGIARQGRSLGVHLILATQNPRSAVDDQVRQNSTFRISLRVSGPEDSTELIGIPDAVSLTKGTAILKARETTLFRVAFAASDYRARVLPDNAIVRLLPNNKRQVLYPVDWYQRADQTTAGNHSESQAIVSHLKNVCDRLEIPKPPPVWQDPLPDRLYLPDLLKKQNRLGWDGSGWTPLKIRPAPILGRQDDPAHQEQADFEFDPFRGGGHLLVFGSPGSGKSTLLRTIVTNLLRNHSPAEVNIYILDMAGQSAQKVFEGAPQVGAVITRAELERIDRLIGMLRRQIAWRGERFRQVPVPDLQSYNARMEDPRDRLPILFVVMDDFGELKQNYNERAREFASLLNSGLSAGIYFVIAAHTDSDLIGDMFSNVQHRVTFSQAEHGAQNRLVGYISESTIQAEYGTQIKPGRGLTRGNPPLFFQAALPTAGATDDAQENALRQLVEKMQAAWKGPAAPRIPILEYEIPLRPLLPEVSSGQRSSVPGTRPLVATLGIENETLRPARITLGEDGHLFLIASINPKLGKTTALYSWALSMAETYSDREVRFLFFDFPKRTLKPLSRLPHCSVYVNTKDRLGAFLEELEQEVTRRKKIIDAASLRDELPKPDLIGPAMVIFIDNYPDFSGECDENQKNQLLSCLAGGQETGVNLVAAGNMSDFMLDFQDELMRRIRTLGSGIVFSPKDDSNQFMSARFNARFPSSPVVSFPPGRGYLVKRGKLQLVQIAMHYRPGEDLYASANEWIHNIDNNGSGVTNGPH